MKKLGAMGTAVYGAYKWVEGHADEVEKACDKVAGFAKGKSYERFVVIPTDLVRTGARWLQENGGDKPPEPGPAR